MSQRKADCLVAGRRHDDAVADGLGKQIMRWVGGGAAFAVALVLCGCCVSAVKHGETKAISARVLWWTENFSATVQTTNINAQLNLGKSATDSKSVGAVTEGAVKALTRP